MAFWSKLGKGLVKVGKYAAPVAAGIFGGPAAAMAVSGGMNALDKKMSGGSWKDALGSAAIGAGTSYLGGKIPGADKFLGKGLSPSKNFSWGNFAKDVGKSALKGETGISWPGSDGGFDIPLYAGGSIRVGGNKGLGPSYAGGDTDFIRRDVQGVNDRIMDSYNKQNGGGGWSGFLKNALPAIGAGVGGYFLGRGTSGGGGDNEESMYGSRPAMPNYEGRMRGLGPVMGRRDQNFPNLAESIGAGRLESIRNQPFRKGYDVIGYSNEKDEEGNYPEIRTPMPPIYPTGGGRRRRQEAAY
jgi:hypothetical protein